MGSTCFGNADVIVLCFTWGPKSGGICASGKCVHDHVAIPRRLARCGAQMERLLPSSFLPGFKSPPYWSPDPITLTAHSWCLQRSPENSPLFPAESWPRTAGAALPLPPRIPSPLNQSQASSPPPQAVWQGSRPPRGSVEGKDGRGCPRKTEFGGAKQDCSHPDSSHRNKRGGAQPSRLILFPQMNPPRHGPVTATEGCPCGRNHQEWGGIATLPPTPSPSSRLARPRAARQGWPGPVPKLSALPPQPVRGGRGARWPSLGVSSPRWII